MRPPRPDFERFLRKVHHRFVALRILEQTALGVLLGCAAGLPLIVLALWRSVPPAPLAAGALGLGALGGFLFALFHRPTLHDAATESDRQLDTSDLLSTALSLRHSPDPWAGAVVATADVWARKAQPSSVLLNRLGARAWGGIGLATALVVVLTLIPTYASPLEAADHSAAPSTSKATDNPAIAKTSPRRTVTERQPEDLRANRDNSEENTGPHPPTMPANRESASRSGPDSSQGPGESHTLTRSQNAPSPSDATRAKSDAAQGRSADGAGASASNAAPGESNSSQSAATPTPEVAPWKSSQWPEQSRQALHEVDSGRVPDTYRDVIRDYFGRK